MDPARRRAKYEDLFTIPEHWVGQIIDGDLIAHPRPAPAHARATSRVGVDIGGPFDAGRGGPGGWWILFEPELHFGEDVLVPDLAGWRRERLPRLPEAAFFTLAPDWVCEVLSSSTAAVDRARKLPVYAREGVAHAWLIDPAARTLEVLRREGGGWMLVVTHAGDARVRAEPFHAVEIDLAPLWPEAAEAGERAEPADRR